MFSKKSIKFEKNKKNGKKASGSSSVAKSQQQSNDDQTNVPDLICKVNIGGFILIKLNSIIFSSFFP